MRIVYPAIIEQDKEGFYATFPDLPGCLTDGNTQEAVLTNAEEALTGYILARIELGLPIAHASNPSAVVLPKGAYLALIRSDITPSDLGKSMNKTLTLPVWLNQRAVNAHVNFSQVLQDALMRKLNII